MFDVDGRHLLRRVALDAMLHPSFPYPNAGSLDGRVVEQETDTLTVVRSTNGLCNGRRDVDDLELLTLLLLLVQGHGIRDHDPGQDAVVEDVDGVTAEDAVGDDSDDFFGSVVREDLRSLGERPAGVCHIVYQDSDLVSHISDQHHAANDVGTRALLVDEGKASVEAICY